MKKTYRVVISVIIVVALFAVIASTPYFGSVKTNHFSPYAACKKANESMGSLIFDYGSTYSQSYFKYTISYSNESFGYICETIGVGPFWIVVFGYPLASCYETITILGS